MLVFISFCTFGDGITVKNALTIQHNSTCPNNCDSLPSPLHTGLHAHSVTARTDWSQKNPGKIKKKEKIRELELWHVVFGVTTVDKQGCQAEIIVQPGYCIPLIRIVLRIRTVEV